MPTKEEREAPYRSNNPVLTARVPYDLKRKIEEDCYSRGFSPNQYVRLVLEKVENEFGGLEGIKTFQGNNGEDPESIKKENRDLQNALERENLEKEAEHKKVAGLDKKLQETEEKFQQERVTLREKEKELASLREHAKALEEKNKELKGFARRFSYYMSRHEYNRIFGEEGPSDHWQKVENEFGRRKFKEED
ncbi:MAG: hypothetical protein ABEH38_04790 [Flavobacteriales bacterium]